MTAGNGQFAMLPVEMLVLDTSNPRVARYIEMYGGTVTDEQMSLALVLPITNRVKARQLFRV